MVQRVGQPFGKAGYACESVDVRDMVSGQLERQGIAVAVGPDAARRRGAFAVICLVAGGTTVKAGPVVADMCCQRLRLEMC